MFTIFRSFSAIFSRSRTALILNVIGLSIAFASFIIIMMQVSYHYGFDKFHKEGDRIYKVYKINDGEFWGVVPGGLLEQLKTSPDVVSGALLFTFHKYDFSINGPSGKTRFIEDKIIAQPSVADVFDFEMIEGLATSLNNPDNALIPQSLAKKLFGNESAIGKILTTENKNNDWPENDIYTVGGVYKDFPKNSSIPNTIFLPLTEEFGAEDWTNSTYNAYIKINDPTNKEKVERDFNQSLGFLDIPEFVKPNSSISLINIRDVHLSKENVAFDSTTKSSRQTLLILTTIAFIIIIIAAVNFNNFSMALTPLRIKSINTKKILGATTKEIRMSLLAEGIAITLVSYFISLLLVSLAYKSPIAGIVDTDIAITNNLSLVMITGLLAIFTGIISGIYPSYYITSFQPGVVLKGSFGLSRKGVKFRNSLIGIQFVVSYSLIICSAFMLLQNRFMKNQPLGYDKDQLIVVRLSQNLNSNKSLVEDRLKTFPEVANVSFGSNLLSALDNQMSWGANYQDKQINFELMTVDHNFLETIGLEVTEGRNFLERDEEGTGVIIFNEKARFDFDLRLHETVGGGWEIIGFIPDLTFHTFRKGNSPFAFYISSWTKDMMQFAYVHVTKGSDMRQAYENIKSTLAEIDSEEQFDVAFYDDVLNFAYENERKLTKLIGLFSLLAIFISLVGIFGLILFDNAYRRKEISIRKVLGSSVSQVLALINSAYAKILLVCFILSVPISYYAITHWLQNFTLKTPLHWWVFGFSGIAILTITIIIVTWQSWKAATANPVNALKTE